MILGWSSVTFRPEQSSSRFVGFMVNSQTHVIPGLLILVFPGLLIFVIPGLLTVVFPGLTRDPFFGSQADREKQMGSG